MAHAISCGTLVREADSTTHRATIKFLMGQSLIQRIPAAIAISRKITFNACENLV
ncbi:hypothetical protein JXJ21_23135 [candidate division KSB1 bacterium]|nr:hypothetical protein [candidate division KSB1 bacterium]